MRLTCSDIEKSPSETHNLALQAFDITVHIGCNAAAALHAIHRYLVPMQRALPTCTATQCYTLQIAQAAHAAHPDGGVLTTSPPPLPPVLDPPPYHHLYVGGVLRLRSPTLHACVERLVSDVHHHVAEHCRQRLFVHAGVVGWRGKAIILPGRSCVGKSTLVEALVRAGASYYSDEFAVLDTEGFVEPYAKPIAMRSREQPHNPRRFVTIPPHATGNQRLPVGLVLSSVFHPQGRWHLQPLSSGAGLLELMANTVPVRQRPQETLRILARAMAYAQAFKLERGEADTTARRVLQTW